MINGQTKKNKKRILVTGGLGFIGKHLTKMLSDKGYEIIVLDNLFRWNKYDTRRSGMNMQKVIFMEGSICDKEILGQIVNQVDIVVHLASISQVMTCLEFPDKCFEYNVIGTKNIAESCAKYNKRLIFSSSREVYGQAKYLPVDLNHPLFPENPYGASKAIGEHIIRYNYPEIQYTIFRLSNVYGSGDKGRVVPIFFQKANSNKNITVFGNNKIVDFVYIDDVVDAFLFAIENNKETNRILNIGSGTPTKLKKLAEIILEITGSKSKIDYGSSRRGETDQFIADISETIKEFKWRPKVKLMEGLTRLNRNYNRNIEKYF